MCPIREPSYDEIKSLALKLYAASRSKKQRREELLGGPHPSHLRSLSRAPLGPGHALYSGGRVLYRSSMGIPCRFLAT